LLLIGLLVLFSFSCCWALAVLRCVSACFLLIIGTVDKIPRWFERDRASQYDSGARQKLLLLSHCVRLNLVQIAKQTCRAIKAAAQQAVACLLIDVDAKLATRVQALMQRTVPLRAARRLANVRRDILASRIASGVQNRLGEAHIVCIDAQMLRSQLERDRPLVLLLSKRDFALLDTTGLSIAVVAIADVAAINPTLVRRFKRQQRLAETRRTSRHPVLCAPLLKCNNYFAQIREYSV
jgi:hypothetical protein